MKRQPLNKFYRGKYIIALYDMEDNIVDVFDNAHELAKATEKTIANIDSKLHKLINGKIDNLFYKGIKTKVYFIEIET